MKTKSNTKQRKEAGRLYITGVCRRVRDVSEALGVNMNRVRNWAEVDRWGDKRDELVTWQYKRGNDVKLTTDQRERLMGRKPHKARGCGIDMNKAMRWLSEVQGRQVKLELMKETMRLSKSIKGGINEPVRG
jgi:uncharacterized protein YjcR